MKNAYLMEKQNVKIEAPVDLNTAGLVGARIKLDDAFRIAVVIALGASTGATVAVTLRQHNAASGGISKALSVDNPYYVKAGLTAAAFTKVVPGAAASVFDISTTFAAAAGVAVFEVLADQLDTTNGFAWFSVEIADSVAAKLGAVQYHLHECKELPAYAIVL